MKSSLRNLEFLLCIAGISSLNSLQISQYRIQSSIVHILARKHNFHPTHLISIYCVSEHFFLWHENFPIISYKLKTLLWNQPSILIRFPLWNTSYSDDLILDLPVALINERFSDALDPYDFHFMRYKRCPDVWIECIGYCEVMLRAQVVQRVQK